MVLKYIDLKQDRFTVKKYDSDRIVSIRNNNEYTKNSNLISLNFPGPDRIFFSYLDSKIYSISQDNYTKYLENFSNLNSFPKILLDSKIIRNKNDQTRDNTYEPPLKLFQQMQFNLSPNCTLRCKYCYASSGRRPETEPMTFKLAKKAIDFVSQYCNNQVNLVFVGEGEPTLELDLLKKIVSYAKKKIKNVKVNPLSTNGVISSKVADWLIDNVDTLQISCDGPAFIQNKYRPMVGGKGSSVYVEKTIKYLRKKGKDFRVRATITEDTFGNEKEIINYFFNLGVKRFAFGGLDDIGESRNMKSENFQQNMASDRSTVFQESIKLEELQEEIGMQEYDPILNRIGSHVTCGISTKSFFVIDPYGNVSACDRHNSPYDFKTYPFMKDFLIGKYNFEKEMFEIDFEKLDKIKKTIDLQMQSNKCSSCSLFSACGTTCLYYVGLKYGKLHTKHSSCLSVDKRWITFIFNYLSEKYFINKKPCLETKNGKLIFKLLHNEFLLHPQNSEDIMADNPYLFIKNLEKLDSLAKKIIKYKNSRKELTLFLLKFSFEKEEVSQNTGKKITKLFRTLKTNNVYFKLSVPIPSIVFGDDYDIVCNEYRLPKHVKDCFELYVLKGNHVIFPNGQKGTKKFDEYANRDEIYSEYRNYKNKNIVKSSHD